MFGVRMHSRDSQAMAATVEMHLITSLEKWVMPRPVHVVEHREWVHSQQIFPESPTNNSDSAKHSDLSQFKRSKHSTKSTAKGLDSFGRCRFG